MAPSKKKHKTDTDTPAKPAARRQSVATQSVAEAQVSQTLDTPGENLLKKLPAELRNQIYQDVLTEAGNVIRVRHRRSRWFYANNKSTKRTPWVEPALLTAAKWIRAEAKLLYFNSARIEVLVVKDQIEAACQWLSVIADGDEEKWLGHVHFYLSSGRWNTLHSWFPLALLFCNYDLGYIIESYHDFNLLRSEHVRLTWALN
ncbi:hypothetical protein LTR53_015449 [Teratosphaeriaceae sp. CCFEE 6253]|nr:hypothetical protein LTR53_015449 [Teratosphaeriaceae sp. CCFEE 6253]